MKNVALALTVVLSAATGASAQGIGTELTLGLDDAVVSCQGTDGANVSVAYGFTTTAASLTAFAWTFTGSGGSVAAQGGYVIPAGESGWTGTGRLKSHEGLLQQYLPNGEYILQVCGTQPGSGGNPDKTTCETQPVKIDCVAAQTNPCANTAAFGMVTGNTQISPTATAQIQFRGDLGPSAMVTVSKDGFTALTLNPAIPQNGGSCTYHASWKFNTMSGADIFGNDGAGVYTVDVTGANGNTVPQFSVTLSDPKGGKK